MYDKHVNKIKLNTVKSRKLFRRVMISLGGASTPTAAPAPLYAAAFLWSMAPGFCSRAFFGLLRHSSSSSSSGGDGKRIAADGHVMIGR